MFAAGLTGLADRLAVRLGLLMTVALLPLGAIAISSGIETQRRAQAATERRLVLALSDSLRGQRALIESALTAGQSIQRMLRQTERDTETCDDYLSQFVNSSGIFSFAAVIDLDGVMRCTSTGTVLTVRDTEGFADLLANPRRLISTSSAGAATGLPVAIVTQPFWRDGELDGFVSISITQRSFELLGVQRSADAPAFATLINRRGQVISLSDSMARRGELPAGLDLAELVAGGPRTLTATSQDGGAAVYAVAELVAGQLYALGRWDADAPEVQELNMRWGPVLFPAAMWLASLAVVLLALNHLILRHLRSLNARMRRFALGQREDFDDLDTSAPAELRSVNATFRNMARLIARDQAEREAALSEKTVLLKEIHHRVKNNLQLIASILNLQVRQVRDSGARAVLHSVQERVLGLAAIHRSLYEGQKLDEVRANEVLAETAGRLVALGTGPQAPVALRCDLAPAVLIADRMVPLSFLMTEAVTNALKHLARAPSGDHWIAVRLTWLDDGRLELAVVNPLVGASDDGRAPTGIGRDLIEAFAQQLEGELTAGSAEEDGRPVWRLQLRFAADVDQPRPQAATVAAA